MARPRLVDERLVEHAKRLATQGKRSANTSSKLLADL